MEMSNTYVDTVKALSKIYELVVLINLTTEKHNDILLESPESMSSKLYSEDMSVWFERIAGSGQIHTEDKEAYLSFTDIANLRQSFEKGQDSISLEYRRKTSNGYRWACIEFVKSERYSAEEPLVVMYIQDTHDTHTVRFDRMLKNVKGFVEFTKIDITTDSCKGRTIEEYIGDKSQRIIDLNMRKCFLNTFSRENMLQQFEGGNASLTVCSRVKTKKSTMIRLFKTTLDMSKDELSDEVSGVLYTEDVSEEYVNERLMTLLYEHNYECVGILDTENSKAVLKKNDLAQREYAIDSEIDYDEMRISVMNRLVAAEDRQKFLKFTEISSIKEKLMNSNEYDFSVFHSYNNEKRLKKYRFIYFNNDYNVVLCTIEDVTSIAEKDILTGGLNRRGLLRYAGNIIRNNLDTEYAILFFDVKGFKAVNEIFGIEAADNVLRYIHDSISSSKLDPLVIARLEADHFVCLVRKEKIDYDELARLCQSSVSQKGKIFTIYLRCGIYYVSDRNESIIGMCDRAKLACSYIDNDIVKPYAVFDSDMKQKYIDRTELINEIKHAIDNGDIKVFYQPIYDAKTQKIASAEALVRWQHPDRGIVSPGLFIPALEENGHISQVDLYVAKSVNKLLTDRAKNNKAIVPVSINLSWMDFYDNGIIDVILKDMKKSNLKEGVSRFEVTETSYASLSENDMSILESLKGLGAKILLDDFGSGYSSFSTIRDYDFDIIKLDMGFVQKINVSEKAESIIHSIIDMAHHMNAKVIAEGAETESQVEFLKKHGCDYIQGFYFSKPLAQNDFEKLLDSI